MIARAGNDGTIDRDGRPYPNTKDWSERVSNETADVLRATVDDAFTRLRAVPDEVNGRRPSAGAWSPREIIGHLIDSAANNHQRFVRAQGQDDLIFSPYEQDDWVARQGYQDADWASLLELWRGYNRHLARVIERIPAAAWSRPRARHNLDRIAWRTVPADEPTTLEYFVRDYVGHLRHHLAQIEGLVGERLGEATHA